MSYRSAFCVREGAMSHEPSFHHPTALMMHSLTGPDTGKTKTTFRLDSKMPWQSSVTQLSVESAKAWPVTCIIFRNKPCSRTRARSSGCRAPEAKQGVSNSRQWWGPAAGVDLLRRCATAAAVPCVPISATPARLPCQANVFSWRTDVARMSKYHDSTYTRS